MNRIEESYRSQLRPWSAGALVLLASLVACGTGEKREAARQSGEEAPKEVAAAPAGQASGEALYQRCVTCHQANGQGTPGAFPPLAGSEFANASNPAVPIRVLLHGLQGPITVKGTQYNSVMPAYGTGVEMSDDEIAAVLTYVRQSWGNASGAVKAEDVARERAAARTATGPATAEELKAMM